jgi:hypothetical protein
MTSSVHCASFDGASLSHRAPLSTWEHLMAKPAPTALFPIIHHPKKRAFLKAYVDLGKVVDACQSVSLDHSMHYYWLRTDADYADAFTQAKVQAGERLEEEAFARAYAGSDTLLIFLLKGAMPHKYGDKVAHTGATGKEIVMRVVYEDTRTNED